MPRAKVNEIEGAPVPYEDFIPDVIARFNEIGFDPFSGGVEWQYKVDLEFFHNRKLLIVRDTACGKEITFY